jgi:hypothetical protein
VLPLVPLQLQSCLRPPHLQLLLLLRFQLLQRQQPAARHLLVQGQGQWQECLLLLLLLTLLPTLLSLCYQPSISAGPGAPTGCQVLTHPAAADNFAGTAAHIPAAVDAAAGSTHPLSMLHHRTNRELVLQGQTLRDLGPTSHSCWANLRCCL